MIYLITGTMLMQIICAFRPGTGMNIFGFTNHLGIYPGRLGEQQSGFCSATSPDAAAVEHFKPQLEKYKTSKGAIQFPYKDLQDGLPLITEISAWCAEHNAK